MMRKFLLKNSKNSTLAPIAMGTKNIQGINKLVIVESCPMAQAIVMCLSMRTKEAIGAIGVAFLIMMIKIIALKVEDVGTQHHSIRMATSILTLLNINIHSIDRLGKVFQKRCCHYCMK